MTEPQSIDGNEPEVTVTTAVHSRPPATPRWVKVTGLVIAVLVLAVLAKVLFLGGAGGHGPGRHGGLSGITPPSSSSPVLSPVPAWPGL